MTFIFDNALIVESKSWTLVHTDYEDRPFALYADGIEIAHFETSKVFDIVKKAILANVHCIDLSTEGVSFADCEKFIRN
ncbi:MAG: hypothetical protein IJ558_11625 [Treponema sp.]|nr:hypothetical protein [Treponema sp.]